MSRIKVLVVDDSAVIRKVIADVLSRSADFEVTAAVADPLLAMHRMELDWPDVIVLDIEMPRMDGLTFLRKIMAEHPTPVVICSTLTARGAQTTMAALAAGAIAVVAKPRIGAKEYLADASSSLTDTIRSAAHANVARLASSVPVPMASHESPHIGGSARAVARSPPSAKIVAIGASTGGTQALECVLSSLGPDAPAIAIVQHMHEKFTAAFAARLNEICRIDVRQATNGEAMTAGCALIAPGGKHLLVHRGVNHYLVEVREGPLVNRHRPSVDVLFRSVAASAGRGALGVIMTGMGRDGAHGLLDMRKAGSRTMAQDERTCVVFGMPKEAIDLGAAQLVGGLDDIAAEIMA